MSEDPQQVLQRLYAEQRMVSSNLEVLEERIEVTNLYLSNYRTGLAVLEELEKHGQDNEILFNVGGGLFVQATLSQPIRLLSELGSGVRIEVSREDAIRTAKEAIERLEERLSSLKENYQKMGTYAATLNAQLQQIGAQLQKDPQKMKQQEPEE